LKIALIGYGKMGRAIEAIAVERGHQVILKIDIDNPDDFTRDNLQKAQVAIEFTKPEVAYDNIVKCISFDTPVVSGSTGWYNRLDEVKQLCMERRGAMLCTSNFSLGVNIFFEINRHLAKIMNQFPSYRVEIEETHHIQKLDAPSGTAITLAEGISDEIPRLKQWKLGGSSNEDTIPVRAIREDNVPGIHNVRYQSEVDDIEIIHTAHSRKGFALGAVMAAEFIHDKKGVFSMKDVLGYSRT
jgi:4-hydroxy-tetrahydrodipicolinate reductase